MDKAKFPQGLRTEIESAGNVSGGEKQVRENAVKFWCNHEKASPLTLSFHLIIRESQSLVLSWPTRRFW